MAADVDTPPAEFNAPLPTPSAQAAFNAEVVETALALPPEDLQQLATEAPAHELVCKATMSLFGRALIAADKMVTADLTLLDSTKAAREREKISRRLSRTIQTGVVAGAGYKAATKLAEGVVDHDAEFAQAVRALSDGLNDALKKSVLKPPTVDLAPGDYTEDAEDE